MDIKERYAAIKEAKRTAFHGKTYKYFTQAHGTQTIGVLQGLGDSTFIVGWISDNGSRKRVKSGVLPPHNDPVKLQGWLDAWAIRKKLLEVTA